MKASTGEVKDSGAHLEAGSITEEFVDGAGLECTNGWMSFLMICYGIEAVFSTEVTYGDGNFINICKESVHSGAGAVFSLFDFLCSLHYSFVVC